MEPNVDIDFSSENSMPDFRTSYPSCSRGIIRQITDDSDSFSFTTRSWRLQHIPLTAIPKAHPLEHTMTHSLTRYVEGKVAVDLLDAAAASRMKVVVIGTGGLDPFAQADEELSYERLHFSYKG